MIAILHVVTVGWLGVTVARVVILSRVRHTIWPSIGQATSRSIQSVVLSDNLYHNNYHTTPLFSGGQTSVHHGRPASLMSGACLPRTE